MVGKPLEPLTFAAIKRDDLNVTNDLPVGLPSQLLAYQPDNLAA